MKTQHIVLSVLSLFLCSALFAQAKKETVKVWGNCGMCEKNIETAAKAAGATDADWNKETKMLAVSFEGKNTNLDKIEQAIANAGYDTQRFTAPDGAYFKLETCCQYDRKTASAKTVSSADDCCKKATGTANCGKDGSCKDCASCKDGKCGDCCKDGKCSAGKDCCKKSADMNATCKDGKCAAGADCCKAGTTKADCCKDGKCSAGSDCCKKGS